MDVLNEFGKALSYAGKTISSAVDSMIETNRRKAMISRIRVVIRNERENTERTYAALGKYYFEHLRDPENGNTEQLCRAVEESEARLKRAFDKLDALREEFAKADEEDVCAGCEKDSCQDCEYYANEDIPADPAEVSQEAAEEAAEEAAVEEAEAEKVPTEENKDEVQKDEVQKDSEEPKA